MQDVKNMYYSLGASYWGMFCPSTHSPLLFFVRLCYIPDIKYILSRYLPIE